MPACLLAWAVGATPRAPAASHHRACHTPTPPCAHPHAHPHARAHAAALAAEPGQALGVFLPERDRVQHHVQVVRRRQPAREGDLLGGWAKKGAGQPLSSCARALPCAPTNKRRRPHARSWPASCSRASSSLVSKQKGVRGSASHTDVALLWSAPAPPAWAPVPWHLRLCKHTCLHMLTRKLHFRADEVDAMLGKRGSGYEQETSLQIKTGGAMAHQPPASGCRWHGACTGVAGALACMPPCACDLTARLLLPARRAPPRAEFMQLWWVVRAWRELRSRLAAAAGGCVLHAHAAAALQLLCHSCLATA